MGAYLVQVSMLDRQWIGVSREPFASAAVGVFHRAFLPRCLRIAEPRLNAEAGLKVGPVCELGVTVEGD